MSFAQVESINPIRPCGRAELREIIEQGFGRIQYGKCDRWSSALYEHSPRFSSGRNVHFDGMEPPITGSHLVTTHYLLFNIPWKASTYSRAPHHLVRLVLSRGLMHC
jgi:hypothetical protein